MKYIYTHLGLGDNIVCNGLVRHIAEGGQKVAVFAKPNNVRNVAIMYRDNPDIKVIAMDDLQVREFMRINPHNDYVVAGITREYHRDLNSGVYKTFDEGFYKMLGIPHSFRWEKFHLERDIEREKDAFYNKLGLHDGKEFVFVHDDVTRNRHLKPEYTHKGIQIIKAADYKDVGIFDFLYTLEQAKEVHVMNSSFACMIDTIQLRNEGIFYHEYAWPNTDPALKLNWTIYKS